MPPRAPALIVALLVLGACTRPEPLRTGLGDASHLTYAPAGTGITLRTTVNGEPRATRLTVGAPQGLRGIYTGESGEPVGFYPGCWACGGAMRIDEAGYARLWPLEPGKRVTFLRTAPDGGQARVQISVAGREKVRTPAGTFDTWVLDGRIETLTGPAYSAQERVWWAPDPGWTVKAEGGDSRGNTLSSELADLDLP